MRREEFKLWLAQRIKKKPISDCMSRCTSVETALGVDLDKEYDKDRGAKLLEKISYSRKDANNNTPPPTEFKFKEGANVVQRMTDLRSAVNRYFEFRKEKQTK